MLTANHAMFLDDMLPWKLDPKKGGYTLDDHCYSKPPLHYARDLYGATVMTQKILVPWQPLQLV